MADSKILCISPLFPWGEAQICSPAAAGRGSPGGAQGDVEQDEQHCSHHGCQQGSHPGAELAEVTVLHNGDENGTTHEHGVLQQRERGELTAAQGPSAHPRRQGKGDSGEKGLTPPG